MGQSLTSLEGFIRKIRKVLPDPDEVLLYRGHPQHKFKLHPSVMRDERQFASEHLILRELIASHPAEFMQDSTTLEQLARSQHYSLPTRLLDTTWNPLVALYFAAREDHGTPGEVVVLRVKKSQVKFYDSDTVSCVSNLAHLNPTERDEINFELEGIAFNEQAPIDRLLQFIRIEKPHFRPNIVPSHLKRVLCVKPKRSSKRVLVQSGAFLLFGTPSSLEESPDDGVAVERIRVNGNKKGDILEELDRVAINESSLFPEIENAARYISLKV